MMVNDDIQVEPGKPGAEVPKGKRSIISISQRKTLPINSFVTTLIASTFF